MISTTQFFIFVGAALLMAVTPGPNMVYLISRSICQGRAAGVMSWLGVVLGFTAHMLCASIGLTALFMAVPIGYEILKVTGAIYLLWLAVQRYVMGVVLGVLAVKLLAQQRSAA